FSRSPSVAEFPEVEQVVVLPLAQPLRPGLLRALVPAVFAFHRARHVDPAEFLDGVIADPVAEDRLPRPGERPESGGHPRAHRRTLRPRRALPPAPLHLGPHLVVHRLEWQGAGAPFSAPPPPPRPPVSRSPPPV